MSKKKKKRKRTRKPKEEIQQQVSQQQEDSDEEAEQSSPPAVAEKSEVEKSEEDSSTKSATETPAKTSSGPPGVDWLWAGGILLFIVLIVAFSSDKVSNNISQWFAGIPQSYLLIPTTIPVVLASAVALVLSKFFYEMTNFSFSLNTELTENDNAAVGLAFAGYLIGIALALTGNCVGLFSAENSLQENLGAILQSCAIGFVISLPLMRISGIIHDKLLLHRFSIVKELTEDKNIGTGAVCCGAYIATGLILMSSLLGMSDSQGNAVTTGTRDHLLAILTTFVLGQIVLVIGGFVFQKATSYDFHHEIGERDNPSAGVVFGSFLVALGLIVSAAILGIEVPPGTDIVTVLGKSALVCILAGVLAVIILIIVGIASAKVIFPHASLDAEVCQKNTAVAFILAAVYLTVGLIIQVLFQQAKLML